MVSRDDDFPTPSVAAKSTFSWRRFSRSSNDDDKRHSQCVGAMNVLFIAWRIFSSRILRGDEIHFYLWWSLRVSLNDDDKRHSQCAGEMNPSFIAWSWSVHAHRVVPHSLCGDDCFTRLRGGVRTHTHIHIHIHIHTHTHARTTTYTRVGVRTHRR